MRNNLGKGSVIKVLIEYSIPAILGMLVTVMYSVVDTMFIGNKLGTESLAGVALVFPLSRVANSISILVSAGGGVLFAIALGEKNKGKSKKILGNQIFLALTMCLVLIIAQVILLPHFLEGSAGNAVALEEAKKYGSIFLFCSFFSTISESFNSAMRAQGRPKLVLVNSIVSSVTNIVLDYVFMFPLGMGVVGAALASLIASIVPLGIITYFILKDKNLIRLKIKDIRATKEMTKQILKLGLATAIIPFANGALIGVYNIKLNSLGGTEAVAVYGVYMTLHSVVLMVSSGITVGGMQPLVSYNLGAKNYARVIEAIKVSVKAGTLISFVTLFIIQVFPRQIMTGFIKDKETIDLGVQAVRYGFILIPVMVLTIMISGVYRAMGDAKRALRFNVLRKIVMIFPIVFILPDIIGIKGIWLSRPISDFLSLMIMLPAIIKTLKYLEGKVEEGKGKNKIIN